MITVILLFVPIVLVLGIVWMIYVQQNKYLTLQQKFILVFLWSIIIILNVAKALDVYNCDHNICPCEKDDLIEYDP